MKKTTLIFFRSLLSGWRYYLSKARYKGEALEEIDPYLYSTLGGLILRVDDILKDLDCLIGYLAKKEGIES